MPNQQTEISALINTIEDLYYSPKLNPYLDCLESLITNGHHLVIYRIGDNEPYTTIKDLSHFNNFKKSFKTKQIRTN